MRADGEPAQDVFGADDGERIGLQRAVEGGEDHHAAGLHERRHALDEGRHVGHVLHHFEQQHGVVALPARGKLLGGRSLIGDVEPRGRGMGPGGFDVLRRRVDAGHISAEPRQRLAHEPAAAADVEHA